MFYEQFCIRPNHETTFSFESYWGSITCPGWYHGRTINTFYHDKAIWRLPIFDKWNLVNVMLYRSRRKTTNYCEVKTTKNTPGDWLHLKFFLNFGCDSIYVKVILLILLLYYICTILISYSIYYVVRDLLKKKSK